jgi:hypothetical protein
MVIQQSDQNETIVMTETTGPLSTNRLKRKTESSMSTVPKSKRVIKMLIKIQR